MSEHEALVQRWQAFLDKIFERLDEICAEAEVGVKAIGAQHPDDSLPLGNAITGLDHRVTQLKDRIGTTWDDQVGEKFEVDSKLHDRGLDMKQDAELAFDERWTLAKAKWLSDLARDAFPRAIAAIERPALCTSCGAPLTVKSRLEVEAVTCGHCSVVNQVAPPPAVSSYFGFGVQNLADAAALPHRHAIERQRVKADRWRRARDWAPEPLESLEEWERMERTYWRTFAEERARLRNEPVDEAYVESRMAFFYKFSLETNQVWVRAKGKRYT